MYKIYFMKHKSAVIEAFLLLTPQAELHTSFKIKTLQCDDVVQYESLNPFPGAFRILKEVSCSCTSQQNEVFDRRQAYCSGRLAQAYLLVKYVYLINRLPSPVLHNKSPFELIFKTKPDHSLLRPFECLSYPHLRPINSNKLRV